MATRNDDDEVFLLDLVDPKGKSWEVRKSEASGLLHTQAKVRAGGGTVHVNVDHDEYRQRIDRVRAMLDVRYGQKSKQGNKAYPTVLEVAAERARIELLTARLFQNDGDWAIKLLPRMLDRTRLIGSKMAADAFHADRINLYHAFTNALPTLVLAVRYRPEDLGDVANQFAHSVTEASRWLHPETGTPANSEEITELRRVVDQAMKNLVVHIESMLQTRLIKVDLTDPEWSDKFASYLTAAIEVYEQQARRNIQQQQAGDGEGQEGEGQEGEGKGPPATASAFGAPAPKKKPGEEGNAVPQPGTARGSLSGGDESAAPGRHRSGDQPTDGHEGRWVPPTGGSKSLMFAGEAPRPTETSVSHEAVREILKSTIDERFDSDHKAQLPRDVQQGLDNLAATGWGEYSDHEDEEGEKYVTGLPLIYDTPRSIPLPAKLKGRVKKASERGKVLRHPDRWARDKRVFSTPLSGIEGTVLIDQSGSMSLSLETLQLMMEILPAVTIAGYCGRPFDHNGKRYQGSIALLAKNGMRCDPKYFKAFPADIVRGIDKRSLNSYESAGRSPVARGGSNSVDLAALTWLTQQAKTRIWISDGGVTGFTLRRDGTIYDSSERFSKTIFDQCVEVVRRGQIVHLSNQEELKEYVLRKGPR